MRFLMLTTAPTTGAPLPTAGARPRPLARAALRHAALLVGLGLSACAGDDAVEPFTPITDPERLFMRLELNHPAINLSTVPGYNTVQLTATLRDGTGAPLADLPAPTFSSSDPTKVAVTAEGLVTALQAASGVKVVAEVVAPGNMRQADTAIVNASATADPPPELATFAIDPVAPDSALLAIQGDNDLGPLFWLNNFFGVDPAAWGIARRTRTLTAAGDTIRGLAVEYASLDPAVATIDRRTGSIAPRRPGTVRLVARTFAYGVSKVATATLTITPPVAQSVTVRVRGEGQSIFGPTIIVRPNGVVFWLNTLQPVEVVFDTPAVAAQPATALCDKAKADLFTPAGPELCGTGDFALPFSPSPSLSLYLNARARQFPTPGTYTYRDAHTGATGTIVVTSDGGI